MFTWLHGRVNRIRCFLNEKYASYTQNQRGLEEGRELSLIGEKISANAQLWGIKQAYREPVTKLLLDCVTEGAFLGTEYLQHDLHMKEGTEEDCPFQHFRCLEVCRIGNDVACLLEDVQIVPLHNLNSLLVVRDCSWSLLGIQRAQRQVVMRLSVDKRVVLFLHPLQGLICEREVGVLHV